MRVCGGVAELERLFRALGYRVRSEALLALDGSVVMRLVVEEFDGDDWAPVAEARAPAQRELCINIDEDLGARVEAAVEAAREEAYAEAAIDCSEEDDEWFEEDE